MENYKPYFFKEFGLPSTKLRIDLQQDTNSVNHFQKIIAENEAVTSKKDDFFLVSQLNS